MDEEDQRKMATTEKELNEMRKANRKDLIKKIGNKVADRNDAALRKLSKN